MRGDEVGGEPLRGEPGHGFEGARLLEEVGGAGHDLERRLGAQLRPRVPVELEHLTVGAPDDEQRGRLDTSQSGAGQVGPPASGDDGTDGLGTLGGGDQCGGATRAGPEVADRQAGERRMVEAPRGSALQSSRQQRVRSFSGSMMP